MRRKLFTQLILALVFQACLAGAASAQELARGVVIEKVECLSDARQSYALYLPTSYSGEKKFPVLYAFDPSARGRVPVERFRAAAEKYGWIVVGSNNSRNGPLKDSVNAARAMVEDAHRRFSVDEAREYAAGFSGGARLAITIASRCGGCMAGVIACGAGFPPELKPSASLPFALFVTMGVEDFNFPEIVRLESELGKLPLAHRVELFDGRHEWAPAELSTMAVGWMELQAHKSGKRKGGTGLVEELWQEGLGRAGERERAGRAYEAYRDYRALEIDYDGLRDVSAVREKVRRLAGDKVVKSALKEQGDEARRQRELMSELLSLLEARRGVESRVEASGSFGTHVKTLKSKSRQEQDGTERRVARRTLNAIFVLLIEEGLRYRDSTKASLDSLFYLETAAEIQPENPFVQFHLACVYSLRGEKRRGLQALTLAVEKGFADRAEITGNKSLAPLREEEGYKKLLERLGQMAAPHAP